MKRMSEWVNTTSEPTKRSLCVGVLTHNESSRIDRCLASARFADQIVVVDSGSTDDTVVRARANGAEVYEHPDWQGFGEQRTRLLQHVKCDWIFFLDADEVITDALREEIRSALEQPPAVWSLGWEQVAFGHRLSRMGSTGTVRRLFPLQWIERFEGEVHEQAVLTPKDPPIQRFRHRLLHYSMETVHSSLRKLSQYAQLGGAKRRRRGRASGIVLGLIASGLVFLRLYLLQRGFLHGAAGFLYCHIRAQEVLFRHAAAAYDPAEPGEYSAR